LNEKKRKGKKDTELRLISELMRNSRRSDRELAKALKVSQPTVTRIRTRLEEEGTIKEYTMIPDFGKLGVEIVAVTFGKWSPDRVKDPESTVFKEAKQFITKHPSIVFGSAGNGLGKGTMVVTLHKTYTDYVEFITEARRKAVGLLTDVESFIISVKLDAMPRHFSLGNLMEYLNPASHDRIE